MSFASDRAEVFLSHDRGEIGYFCRRYDIEIYLTCLQKFWPLVNLIILHLPEATEKDREKARKLLYQSGMVVEGRTAYSLATGLLTIPDELQL